MSYEFKKIADLELVNEVPEGANVLIETEGATKRLPSAAIKGSVDVVAEVGQTIVVKSVDENGEPTEWEAVDLPSIVVLNHNEALYSSGKDIYFVNKLLYDNIKNGKPTVIFVYRSDGESTWFAHVSENILVNFTPNGHKVTMYRVGKTEMSEFKVLIFDTEENAFDYYDR